MEPDWKFLLMRILNCFGHMQDDWYEQYWHKFGVTREEGKKIVEEYIKEVSRVLKPGCLFRFQVRGKINSKPKKTTTWDGVQFTSDEIHIMAEKNNFDILEEGDYTKEYYWITFRLAKSF